MMRLTEQESLFLNTLLLRDDDLTLRFVEKRPTSAPDDILPEYRFLMVHSAAATFMGHINLRLGYTENIILYRGNIGFAVAETYRGHHYAARSCCLLIPLLRFLRFNLIWITCNLGNTASQKTIESLHPNFAGIVSISPNSPYFRHYPEEARIKLRYQWKII